jgi:hypothetical protein
VEAAMTKRYACAILTIALLLTCYLAAGEKQRAWQTGKVLDSERSRYFAGTVGGSNTSGTVNENGSYSGNTNDSQTAIYRVYETFVIEGDTYVYQAQEHVKWRWSKPANLTVNGPVKYAVEKRRLYVIDDDGKEHEMEIVKKTLKTPEPSPK